MRLADGGNGRLKTRSGTTASPFAATPISRAKFREECSRYERNRGPQRAREPAALHGLRTDPTDDSRTHRLAELGRINGRCRTDTSGPWQKSSACRCRTSNMSTDRADGASARTGLASATARAWHSGRQAARRFHEATGIGPARST